MRAITKGRSAASFKETLEALFRDVEKHKKDPEYLKALDELDKFLSGK